MSSSPTRQPVLFVGHGSPMNALDDNQWSRGFSALGKGLAKPRAVLCVSAHWFIEETALTGESAPKTIHDFGGFPRPLYEMQYAAPGAPELAARAAALLGPGAQLRTDWGLDHGAWSVLVHLLPNHDVPVVQLSIDAGKEPVEHLALGRALRGLRDEGVLILGSGNLTHNLRHAMTSMRRGDSSTPDWARRFDEDLARAIEQRDDGFLVRALASPDGQASHPSPDHYLPLLYAYGATEERDIPSYPINGFDLGSLSMRSVLWSPRGL